MPTTTLDPNNKSSGFALSGGNLVATSSALATVAATRTVTGPTYGEVTVTTLTGVISIGFVNRAYNMASGTILGTDNNGIGYKSGGTVVLNNVTLATIAAYVQGNVIGWAINPAGTLVWFRVGAGNWNNDVIANQNPVGNVGGISIGTMNLGTLLPAVGCSATGAVLTANLSGAFANAAPTGYITIDTCAATAVNATVPVGASFTTPTTSTPAAVTPTAEAKASNLGMGRSTALNGGQFSPAGAITAAAGTVKQNGSNVAKEVRLYDTYNGDFLGVTTSDGTTGAFSIPALGRTQVDVVAKDPTNYQAQVFDRVTPS